MNRPLVFLISLAVLARGPAHCVQDRDGRARTRGEAFLDGAGLKSPPPLYRESLDAFLDADRAYAAHDYAGALKLLNSWWAAHPPGTDEWARAYRDAALVGRTAGVNVGCPPAYYALRMLTECARWRTGSEASRRPAATAVLTVVLVGRATGSEPGTKAELEAGTGLPSEYVLDPLLERNGGRVIHDSLRLFREYILAASGGRLAVRVRLLPLHALKVPVRAVGKGRMFAGLSDDAWGPIWQAVPASVRSSTDWWWVLYPSNVPESHPDFERSEFVTGGMGVGPDGLSPCFIIDDRWLTRKPPHLGKGPYTDIERRAYLPQWLQHEFFHHLFRTYAEFRLEARDHQWFDRKTWPADFHGCLEPDYYDEALQRRLKSASRPLHSALRYASPPPALWRAIRLADLVGGYRRDPVENGWHTGAIRLETSGGHRVLRWTNQAGATWSLTPDLAAGLLRSGPDCPYYDASRPEGSAFRVLLGRDANGQYVPRLVGLALHGDVYSRIGDEPNGRLAPGRP